MSRFARAGIAVMAIGLAAGPAWAQEKVDWSALPQPDVTLIVKGRTSASFGPGEKIRKVWMESSEGWQLLLPPSGAYLTVEPAPGQDVVPDTRMLVVTRRAEGNVLYLYELRGEEPRRN